MCKMKLHAGVEGNISTQFPDPTRSPVPDEDPSKLLILSVVDTGGPEAHALLPLLKQVKKRWPLCHTASFMSHQAPLGQISGSATVYTV